MYYGNQLSKYPVLNKVKEKEEFKKLRDFRNSNQQHAYKKQKDFLIQSNLRLVMKISQKYGAHHLDYDDFVQAGIEGLIIAIDRFDPDKENCFGTYATWWITQAIVAHIKDYDNTIRVGRHIYDLHSKIMKTTAKLKESLGRTPTKQEIAQAAKLKESMIKDYSPRFLLPISLNEIQYGSRTALYEIIKDDNSPPPDTNVVMRQTNVILKRKLSRLRPRERQVVKYLYGLEDGIPYTAAEIANKLKLTSERVRQLKNSAFKKLNIKNDLFIEKYRR